MERIEKRVLWLAMRMVDYANREREPGEIKVGGHQASSASTVSIMTALWFGHLGRHDKVAVKSHASPVYHAIKYFIGEIDQSFPHSFPSTRRSPSISIANQGLGRQGLLDGFRWAGGCGTFVCSRYAPISRGPLSIRTRWTFHQPRW